MPKVVVGMYDRIENARDAVDELVQNGIDRSSISLIAGDARGEFGRYVTRSSASTGADLDDTAIDDGAIGGAGVGAVLGGIGGLLLGLGALAIPGFGPIIAAGPIAAALGGAGLGAAAGAVTGGLLGALVDLGIPDERARVYQDGIRAGNILVTARVDDHLSTLAVEILNRHQPLDVDRKHHEWRQFYQQGATGAGGEEAMGGYTGTSSVETPGAAQPVDEPGGYTGSIGSQRTYTSGTYSSATEPDLHTGGTGFQRDDQAADRVTGLGDSDPSLGELDDAAGYAGGEGPQRDFRSGDPSYTGDTDRAIDYGTPPSASDLGTGLPQQHGAESGMGGLADSEDLSARDLSGSGSFDADQHLNDRTDRLFGGTGDTAGSSSDFSTSRAIDYGTPGAEDDFGASRANDMSGADYGAGAEYGSQSDYGTGRPIDYGTPGAEDDFGASRANDMSGAEYGANRAIDYGGTGDPDIPGITHDLPNTGSQGDYGVDPQRRHAIHPGDVESGQAGKHSQSLGDADFSGSTGFESGYDANPDDLDTSPRDFGRGAQDDDTTNLGDQTMRSQPDYDGTTDISTGDHNRQSSYGTDQPHTDRIQDGFDNSFGASPTGGDFQTHYDFGSQLRDDPQYRDRSWDDIELEVRHKWESQHQDTPWERFKDAIRRGWDSITGGKE